MDEISDKGDKKVSDKGLKYEAGERGTGGRGQEGRERRRRIKGKRNEGLGNRRYVYDGGDTTECLGKTE